MDQVIQTVIDIQYKRPAIVNKYEKQRQFLDNPERFTTVEATTKAGKTTGCIVWLFEEALKEVIDSITGKPKPNKEGCNYWWVAPTFPVAKIAFRRFCKYIKPKSLFKANKSELSITLINGAVIWFKGADNPDSLYGEDVYAVVLDEATRMKQDSWFAVFSTLTATEGRCKIIGNVKGIGNWSYKLSREAQKGKKDWAYFKLTADDAVQAGVLKQEVIDEARRTLPNGIFLELYYAIPFVNSSDKFAYSFEEEKHVHSCTVNYDYPIYLSFDFNKNPITCTAIQHYDGCIHIPYCIKLENSNIYRLCDKIKTLFYKAGQAKPIFIVNGDASGNSGSAMVQDNLNYFKIIKTRLKLTDGQMQQLASNPTMAENQVLVNACLEHIPHKIDPTNAAGVIFDFQFATMLPDGTLKKAKRDDPTQQLDALDTVRYYYNRNWQHMLRVLADEPEDDEEDY